MRRPLLGFFDGVDLVNVEGHVPLDGGDRLQGVGIGSYRVLGTQSADRHRPVECVPFVGAMTVVSRLA